MPDVLLLEAVLGTSQLLRHDGEGLLPGLGDELALLEVVPRSQGGCGCRGVSLPGSLVWGRLQPCSAVCCFLGGSAWSTVGDRVGSGVGPQLLHSSLGKLVVPDPLSRIRVTRSSFPRASSRFPSGSSKAVLYFSSHCRVRGLMWMLRWGRKFVGSVSLVSFSPGSSAL